MYIYIYMYIHVSMYLCIYHTCNYVMISQADAAPHHQGAEHEDAVHLTAIIR